MRRALPILCAVTVVVLAVVAIREHSALIREGYSLSEKERVRDELQTDLARVRDRLSRLRSPGLLAERAREFGLATDYPKDFPIVRIQVEDRDPQPVVVMNE